MISVPHVMAIIVFFIMLNGVFACMEIAVVSVSRARLKRMQKEGRAGASGALKLQRNIDDFFATVQVGLTFIATLSSAIGGASAQDFFGPTLEYVGISPSSSLGKVISVMAVTVLIAYITLIIGELVPKSLGRRYPGTISTALAKPFVTFSKIMTPVVRILSASTWIVLKILRVGDSGRGGLTTEEFRMMASELVESKQITSRVHDLIVRVTRLAETRVEDIMIPRHRIVQVMVASRKDPEMLAKVLNTYRKHPFTNLLVTDANGEEILGVANIKDLLLEARPGHECPLRPVMFTARGETVDRLLATMRNRRTHLAVVVDEHGNIDGIVTLEDILEEFVGDIESGVRVPAARPATAAAPGGPIEVDGAISVHELRELHSIVAPRSRHYSTLAGFLLFKLGKIPKAGDFVDHEALRFEVMEMERNRIKRIRISPLVPTAENS